MVCSIDNAETRTLPLAFSSPPPNKHTRGKPIRVSGFRYYSPEIARWLSRDPIEEDGGLNLYGYVGNNGVIDFDGAGLRGYFKFWITPETQLPFGSSYAQIHYHYDGKECQKVEFIQLAWTSFSGRKKYRLRWVTETEDWHIDNGGTVDRINDRARPWYRVSYNNLPRPPHLAQASVTDTPGVEDAKTYAWFVLSQKFKTYAICTKGCDAGKIYGHINWGHFYERHGEEKTSTLWPSGAGVEIPPDTDVSELKKQMGPWLTEWIIEIFTRARGEE